MKKKVLLPFIIVPIIAMPFLLPKEQPVENEKKDSIVTSTDSADVGTPITPTIEVPSAIVESSPVVAPEPEQIQEQPQQPQVIDNNPYMKPSNLAYVYDKRKSAGKTVGNWGHADLWVKYGREAGLVINDVPEYGSAFASGNGGIYFVESVANDTFTASTFMNGVETKEFPMAQAKALRFIH